LRYLGELWKDSPVDTLSNKARRIFQWLTDHPDEEDEAIDNELWLDYNAGMCTNDFVPFPFVFPLS